MFLSIFSEFSVKWSICAEIQLAYSLVFLCCFQISSFGTAEFCAFRSYRDPCCFLLHLSGFRGNLSISAVDFIVRRSSGVYYAGIQLAEPIWFFHVFWDLLFFPPSSVLVIRQYVQNDQKFIWPILETFCWDLQVFIILSSWYNVNSVLLRLMLFFTAFIRFFVYFADFSDSFRCLSFQCSNIVRKLVGLARRLFSVFSRMLFFSP